MIPHQIHIEHRKFPFTSQFSIVLWNGWVGGETMPRCPSIFWPWHIQWVSAEVQLFDGSTPVLMVKWVWINTYENTIFSGMNIHFNPAIPSYFDVNYRGTRFWHTAKSDGLVLRMTLWLCQNSYWTWPVIVDFPIHSMVIFPSVMLVITRPGRFLDPCWPWNPTAAVVEVPNGWCWGIWYKTCGRPLVGLEWSLYIV